MYIEISNTFNSCKDKVLIVFYHNKIINSWQRARSRLCELKIIRECFNLAASDGSRGSPATVIVTAPLRTSLRSLDN